MPDSWVWLSLAIVAAGFVQGLAGFGFGITAMAIVASILPTDQAVPLVALLSIAINGTLALKLRRHLQWQAIRLLLFGSIVGVPAGVFFLVHVHASIIMGVLGGTMITFGVRGLLTARPPATSANSGGEPRPPSTGWGLLAGLFGGALGGAFSTAGPPAVMFLAAQSLPRDSVRASLHLYFCVASVFGCAGYAYAGILDGADLGTALTLLPALPLGAIVGVQLANRIDARRFRQVMMVGLILMGLVFLIRAFR